MLKGCFKDYQNRLLFLCYFKNGNIKTSNQHLASSVRQKCKKDIYKNLDIHSVSHNYLP